MPPKQRCFERVSRGTFVAVVMPSACPSPWRVRPAIISIGLPGQRVVRLEADLTQGDETAGMSSGLATALGDGAG